MAWCTVWEGRLITVSPDIKLRCVLYLLGFAALAELTAMARLLVRQQHLEVGISARAAGDSTSLVVAGGLLYRSLPHRLVDSLACTVTAFVSQHQAGV